MRLTFTAALLPRLFRNNIPSHTTREPPVGFKLATNSVQFYAIANLDKTSHDILETKHCMSGMTYRMMTVV